MSVASCDICGRPVRRLNLERLCNLDVCGKCSRGGLSRKLTARGWHTSVKSWEVQAQGVIHYIEVTSIREERDVPIRASFRPEGITQKAIKLFKREIQVGDRKFDDAIYISTDTPQLTAALLENEGVKGAIIELASTGGLLRIADNTVHFADQSKVKIQASTVHLRICMLLHLIEVFLDSVRAMDPTVDPQSSPSPP